MRYQFFAGVAVAALVVPVVAYAQETTSSVSGTVTAAGAPVAGAEITITHVPSGTVSTVTSGNNGSFAATSLRVGGPFTVKVKADGFVERQVTDVYTVVGQSFSLPLALETTGDEIVVTASRVVGAGTVSQGNTRWGWALPCPQGVPPR